MTKLQSNYTTPEQSKRLLELGVPADSADCYIDKNNRQRIINHAITKALVRNLKYIPCWSVGRLMQIYEICTRKVFERNDVYSPLADIYTTIECECLNKRIDFSKLEE